MSNGENIDTHIEPTAKEHALLHRVLTALSERDLPFFQTHYDEIRDTNVLYDIHVSKGCMCGCQPANYPVESLLWAPSYDNNKDGLKTTWMSQSLNPDELNPDERAKLAIAFYCLDTGLIPVNTPSCFKATSRHKPKEILLEHLLHNIYGHTYMYLLIEKVIAMTSPEVIRTHRVHVGDTALGNILHVVWMMASYYPDEKFKEIFNYFLSIGVDLNMKTVPSGFESPPPSPTGRERSVGSHCFPPLPDWDRETVIERRIRDKLPPMTDREIDITVQIRNSRDDYVGYEILKDAVRKDIPWLIKLCLAGGQDINYTFVDHDHRDNFLIHKLARDRSHKKREWLDGTYETVLLLCKNGIDLSYTNIDGMNARDACRYFGWNNTPVKIILDAFDAPPETGNDPVKTNWSRYDAERSPFEKMLRERRNLYEKDPLQFPRIVEEMKVFMSQDGFNILKCDAGTTIHNDYRGTVVQEYYDSISDPAWEAERAKRKEDAARWEVIRQETNRKIAEEKAAKEAAKAVGPDDL